MVFKIRNLSRVFYLFAIFLVSLLMLLVSPVFAYAEPSDTPKFEIQVTIPSGDETARTFYLPTSGGLNPDGNATSAAYGKSYSWNVDWGDDTSGTYDENSSPNQYNAVGIKHVFPETTEDHIYTIAITPTENEAEAWLGSFGFSINTTASGANELSNRDRVTAVLSPITPSMTRTADQITNSLAPSFEWAFTFYKCQNLSMGNDFTFNKTAWQSITTAGNSFAYYMFYGCSGNTFTMNDVFNLPQDITSVGDYFASYMFFGCSGTTFTMNDVFNLPQDITSVGDFFAIYLFPGCSGDAFTMSDVFNLPQDITSMGDYFACSMFYGCSGNTFSMNEVFNLPQGITAVGNYFASYLFYGCSGDAFTMNEVFSFPQEITSVGNYFASYMFFGCSGNTFTMNEVFNLPQGITSVEEYFVNALFFKAGGPSFQVNNVFRFPVLNSGEVNTSAVFEHAFGLMNASTPQQTRSAHSIINGNETPTGIKSAFTSIDLSCFSDQPYIPKNWGGGGNTASFVVSFVAWGPKGEIPNSLPESQIVDPGDNVIEPTTPALTKHVFKGWYTEAACTNEWKFDTDVVNENTYLYAKWTAPHTITVTAGIGGTVSPGTIDVAEGENQSFSFTPDEYYAIKDVMVDGTSKGAVSSYTFENVTEPHTIEVTFSEIYTQNTLTDVASNISASGLFSNSAELNVVKDRLHSTDTCAACAAIKAKYSAGELYSLHDVTVAGFKPGTQVTVVFPIDAQYNGKEVIIYHCNRGTLEEIPTTVDNAKTQVSLENFSPIGIGKPATSPNSDQGLSNTGDSLPWVYPLATLVLATSGILFIGVRHRRH